MEKKDVIDALNKLNTSKKRNFTQKIELIINFKNLDVKKPENLIDIKVNLPHATGAGKAKALLFARTASFIETVKDMFDRVIYENQIEGLSKKELQEMLDYDIILAEGPVMLTVAKYLGQTLAPKGKMPKPVNPEKSAVESLLAGTESAVRITNKKGKGVPFVQVVIGNENMSNEQIAENAVEVYKEVLHALPSQKHNIKSVYIKKTMSPAVKIL
ncbi:MAG: hypothetical protein QXM75_02495 [Candidatus Diapherotrites archaeon]